MTHKDFKSTKTLENMVTNRKVSVEGNAVNWLKIESIKLLKSKPLKILFKTNHEDHTPYQTIDLQKKRSKQKMNGMDLTSLFLETRPISLAKFKDLHKLTPFLPPVDAAFYANLKTCSAENEDSD